MKNIKYLVFDSATLKIVDTFSSFHSGLFKIIDKNKNLGWLNVTHPKTKGLLADVNKVNGTSF